MNGLYVYGIAGRAVLGRERGIFRRPLRSVPVGGLHAIVESATRAPKPSLARLKAQGRVLDRLVSRGTELLPARFGTFVATERELQDLLRGRVAELRHALRQVRGCAQMTLRITPSAGTVDRVRAARTRTAGSAGTAFLRSRAARDRARRSDPLLRVFAAAAEPLVRASRVETSNGTLTVFHLVPRKKLRTYAAAMADAAGKVSAAVRLSGPFAPFAFVEVD